MIIKVAYQALRGPLTQVYALLEGLFPFELDLPWLYLKHALLISGGGG